MIQVLPLPRQLPRALVWSIYAVTSLGLIVASVVVFLLYNDDEQLKPEREEPSRPRGRDGSREVASAKKPLDRQDIKPNNSSTPTKRSQRNQSRPRTRPGFVSLEEIVAYECRFLPVYQNTTWLEGSDTEIGYLDALGRPRLVNVLALDERPSGTTEKRLMDSELSWAETSRADVARMMSDRDEPSRRVDASWNCSQIEECRHSPDNNIWNTPREQQQQQSNISASRERRPWTSGEFTFIPHSRRRDVDPRQRHRVTPEANALPSPRRRRDVDEPAVARPSVHVTKMILEDETPPYFVAAPISNVSLRFVYHGGDCLTCPGGGDARRLECPYSADAAFSRNARYYVLYCRGPEVPWTAVVSTQRNEIVHRLRNQEKSREWYASRPRPVTRELEVDLDHARHGARVRLHLPSDWRDEGCNGKLRLLLRIADEQRDQMVNAEFDFSLTNYLTTVKGYAVIYADVRASLFQNFDFRHLRFRRRELMQTSDYAKVVDHVLKKFGCIDPKAIGVFGENYGGHMALNLVADNKERRNNSGDDKFRCCLAVNPLAKWRDYVYPFTVEHSNGVTGALRKKMFKRHHLYPLVNRLRGKNFAIHTTSHSLHRHPYYTQNLLKMLKRHAVKFEHRHYDDESASMCDSRLKSYRRASDFFDRCFGREIDTDH